MADRLIVERNVRVPMRDGVHLATDIVRPDVTDPLPVIVKRTPYDRTATTSADYLERIDLALRGYAVVDQDCRGRFASDGVYDPPHQEVADGYDTIEWAAAQPWSNGRVGMHGASYHGATQWLAAIAAPPHLRAFVPNVTSSDYHEGWAYQGGAFQLGFVLYWAFNEFTVGVPGPTDPDAAPARIDALDDLIARYRHRPLPDHPALARWAPWFREWAEHTLNDDWWRRSAPREHYDRVTAPSLNLGGWYDIFVAGTVENFAGVRRRGATDEAREGSRLIVGPWSHRTIFGTGDFADRRYGGRGQTGHIDIAGLHHAWFDRWLRDGPDLPGGRVRVFVMGTNRWREGDDWPLPGTEVRPFYLHSTGGANTLRGDGSLSENGPTNAESPDTYVYDPLDPVPSMGGPTLSQPGGQFGSNAGPYDQRPVEVRPDVLCYTSDPLTEPLEVIGDIALVLYASSSARDTDFTAKLVDVWPDGRAENLCDGILRARYREGLDREVLLTPGKVEEFTINLGPTANAFLPGHRIRLEVSSSNWPRFDPNPNTGNPVPFETVENLRLATNRVFHDDRYPSRLLLPVAPPPGSDHREDADRDRS